MVHTMSPSCFVWYVVLFTLANLKTIINPSSSQLFSVLAGGNNFCWLSKSYLTEMESCSDFSVLRRHKCICAEAVFWKSVLFKLTVLNLKIRHAVHIFCHRHYSQCQANGLVSSEKKQTHLSKPLAYYCSPLYHFRMACLFEQRLPVQICHVWRFNRGVNRQEHNRLSVS